MKDAVNELSNLLRTAVASQLGIDKVRVLVVIYDQRRPLGVACDENLDLPTEIHHLEHPAQGLWQRLDQPN